MYNVVKRDGRSVDFNITRIANAKYPQEYIQKIDAICADKARVAEFCRQHG